MAFFQRVIPKRLLTRLAGALAASEVVWLKNTLIRLAMRFYRISLVDAQIEDIEKFPHFNAFFTRALKASVRPVDSDKTAMISPADGLISEQGTIENGQLLQAKGRHYALNQFLGKEAGDFEAGYFSTIYLSPRDYHRVHMPIDGELIDSLYIPGTLFAVNIATCRAINNLFGRNERLVARFKTEVGEVYIVFVAALMVAGIGTVWHPNQRAAGKTLFVPQQPLRFAKGDEIGRFYFGSTVVVIAPKEALQWTNLPNTPIRMGEKIAILGK